MEKNSKKEKEAELMKKFADMKQKYQEDIAEDDVSEEKSNQSGVLPERNFKKNLGCGG